MTIKKAVHQLEQVAEICTTTALAEACLMGARALEAEKMQLSEEGTTFKWIPCSERFPKRSEHVNDTVLVCYKDGSVRFNSCMNGVWIQGNPIAWMPLPEPYKGG